MRDTSCEAYDLLVQVTLDEMELLKAVGRAREESRNKGDTNGGEEAVVELLDTFEISKPRKQLCMAFEMLGPSLLELIIDYGYKVCHWPIRSSPAEIQGDCTCNFPAVVS